MRNSPPFCLGWFTWSIGSPPLFGRRFGRHAAHGRVIRAARVVPRRQIIAYRLAAGSKPSALRLRPSKGAEPRLAQFLHTPYRVRRGSFAS